MESFIEFIENNYHGEMASRVFDHLLLRYGPIEHQIVEHQRLELSEITPNWQFNSNIADIKLAENDLKKQAIKAILSDHLYHYEVNKKGVYDRLVGNP